MSYIKISSKDEPRFISECSKHISDVLNQKITFQEVADEYFLYKMSSGPKNKVLSKFMLEILKDVTVNK